MSEVNITIFDRSYRLAVTSGEEKILEECANLVNEQMLAVRAAGRVIAIDQIAVLTALELAYEAKKKELEAAAEPVAKTAPAAKPESAPAPAAKTEDAKLLEEVRSMCRICEDALFRDAKMGSLF